jgi:hypothetical protein
MEDLSVPACAHEPGGDGGLSVAENSLSSGRIQPFGQCRQDNSNLLRGGFQTVQGSVSPGSKSGMAGRASKRLNLLGLTMLAISDQGMDLSSSDPEVRQR